MKIEKIKVNGFKNIKDSQFTLGKITSLLSLNNYGKSNVIKGISFGLEFIHQTTIARSNMMSDKLYIPKCSNIHKNIFEFEIEFSMIIESVTYFVLYKYSFLWIQSSKSKVENTIQEYLSIKENAKNKYSSYIKRNGNIAYYKSSKTGRCDKPTNINYNELVVDKLKAIDGLFYLNILEQIYTFSMYIDRHFDSIESYGFLPFENKELNELAISPDKSIPRVLYMLKKDHPDKYLLIINAFMDLFPSIEDIIVREVDISNKTKKEDLKYESETYFDKLYYIAVKVKKIKQFLLFNSMSDGSKRILLLFTFFVLAQINKTSIIAIEEPENSLHPGLLQKFLIAVNNFIDDTNIIFSSHSPYLINYMNAVNVYIGMPRDDGIASFKGIKESCVKKLENDADKFDMNIGDYLFDLMSGTSEDLEVLKTYV